MKRLWVVMLLTVAGVVGCGQLQRSPTSVQPSEMSILPEPIHADSAKVNIRKPGAQPDAVPPSFSGWSVVSGSRTEIFGPIWDQDWKIYFYIPNRSSLPPARVLAAKNLRGTWLDYTKYALLYDYGQSGSYYRVVYVFGGWRANAFGINMFDATNWALYYHY